MQLDMDHLWLLFTFLSVSEAMVSRHYVANLDVDNKISLHAPSDNLHAVSCAICSSLCINECKCFSFNSQSKMCRLYMNSCSCDPSNMDATEEGWRSYTIIETQPQGK